MLGGLVLLLLPESDRLEFFDVLREMDVPLLDAEIEPLEPFSGVGDVASHHVKERILDG